MATGFRPAGPPRPPPPHGLPPPALRLSAAPTDVGPLMAWEAASHGAMIHVSPRLLDFAGADASAWLGAKWLDLVHPEDRSGVCDRWLQAVADATDIDLEFRLTPLSGPGRWVRCVGGRHDGDPPRFAGFIEDIQVRREASEARRLLLLEVEHRGRNLLAVLDGLIQLSPKQDVETFVAVFRRRLGALAGAHGLLGRNDWRRLSVGELVQAELGAYGDRIELSGATSSIGAASVQTAAIILHELATNSTKYGALSSERGRIAIDCRLDNGAIAIVWRESGGPPVARPSKKGFGLRMLEACIHPRGGDSLELSWRPEGLACRIVLARAGAA